jgi:hypothetical protein
MSGIKAQKYWPSQAGEYPEAELVLDSHRMLLYENQKLMHWKTALGTNNAAFKLIALEFSVRLTGARGYGSGYDRYLFDNCMEPSSTHDECNCGF